LPSQDRRVPDGTRDLSVNLHGTSGTVRAVAPADDGHAVHYTAVSKGTPVFGSDDVEVGKVVEVLDNYREHIFDGLVVETPDGARHFVDAPEVARTAELAVTLTIPAADAAALPPPASGSAPAPVKSAKKLLRGLRRR